MISSGSQHLAGPFNVDTLPCYLPLKKTLLQSVGSVTVYHYCPWAIMTQIEGFAVKHSEGAGTRRAVDVGPRGKAGGRWELMF